MTPRARADGRPRAHATAASALIRLLVAGLMACAAGLMACAAGCGHRDRPAAAPPAEPAPEPAAPAPAPAPGLRLVVLVVVDQLPSWSFERDLPLLQGGIARLVQDGVYFPRAEVPYAITYTAPGHAAIGTGAPPAITRILSNHWFDPDTGARIDAIADPDSPILRVPGVAATASTGASASGARLAVDGVADALRQARGQAARSISVGLKDRSTIFAAGRRPDLAVWYDADQLAMTTSRAYAAELPAWLAALARERPIAARLHSEWTPLPDVDHAAITGIADDQPGEGDDSDLGNTFPYRLSSAPRPGRALRATPLGDEIVLEAALAALHAEGLGTDDVPDLLALSLGAHDYAGHTWGQESWERLDLLLRLDRALGAFLDELDRHVGQGAYAVVLTSDHGATRMVEHSLRAGRAAARIRTTAIAAAAEEAAVAALGPGPWVAQCTTSSLYASPALRARSAAERDAALDAMTRAIAAIDGMSHAARVERIAGDCDRRPERDARDCRSVVPGLSGDIFFAPAPDHLITTSYDHGTSHGSPNPDDRIIPIIVSAPGWRPRVATEPVTLLQVAPTLAALLGVPPPPAAAAPALAP